MIPPELILAFALIAVGFLLLAVEIFFPSGVCFALSLVGFVAGIVLAFLYDTKIGWETLIGVTVVFVGMLWLIRYCWTRTALGRNMVLHAPAEEATIAALPGTKERERLIGQTGRAVGPLRPAGIVIFDGERVDCLTEGMLVEDGQMVRCITVQGGRVIVRPTGDNANAKLDLPSFE
jgi:membrane-bound serine protease (ClpP class)